MKRSWTTIIDFIIILISLINLILLLSLKLSDDGVKKEKVFTERKVNQKEKKIQQRVIREISNFLNYNGEEQEETD